MFDIAPSEFMLVAFVALIVIGPKDLPKAMRFVGHWVGKMRGVARQFRAGFDEMVREAELADMEKKWAAENERIMREHPTIDGPDISDPADRVAQGHPADADEDPDRQPPVMAPQPALRPAAAAAPDTDAPTLPFDPPAAPAAPRDVASS